VEGFAGGGEPAVLQRQALDVLNDRAEETLQSDALFDASNALNKSFGQPMTFMDPRRAMLSVRLNLGR